MKRKDYVYLLKTEYGNLEAFSSLKKATERKQQYYEIYVITDNIIKVQII